MTDGAGAVQTHVCKIIQESCSKEKQSIGKRLDKHGEELDRVNAELTDVKILLARVTDLLERTVERMDDIDEREKQKASRMLFHETDTGKLLIKTACTIAIILTLAAVGMSAYKDYLEALFK